MEGGGRVSWRAGKMLAYIDAYQHLEQRVERIDAIKQYLHSRIYESFATAFGGSQVAFRTLCDQVIGAKTLVVGAAASASSAMPVD